MDEIPYTEPTDLRDHVCEQGIGCDIEWNAQKDIGGTLIELATQPIIRDIELKQTMAWC